MVNRYQSIQMHSRSLDAVFRSLGEMVAHAGLAPASFLRTLRRELRATADPRLALNNFHRFVTVGFTSTFLRDVSAHPVLLKTALEIFSQSQYLSDILVRDPQLFNWLTASSALTRVKTKTEYVAEATQSVAPFQRLEKRLDALKRFHRREVLRIGARDILKRGDVGTITGELSALAEAIIDQVLTMGHDDLRSGREIQLDRSFAIIGLGKLGGGELNFSSDIDLLFVYDRDGELEIPERRISSRHEFYVRLSEFIVRKLTEHTNEGHLFRVDMRLRPDGNAGPLAMSRQGYSSYYETRGELWERQMLVKARVVAGNASVGDQWLMDIKPFVYPQTQLRSPLAEIRDMKQRIESRLEGDSNIKLSSGGIRDIEFIVQALQLLHARTEGKLRECNTLRSIDLLAALGRISQNEQVTLRTAYEFFRTVEHRLQLLHGLQTHSLPESREEIQLLAKRLGHTTETSFSGKLAMQRKKVKRIFDSIFLPPKGERTFGVRRSKISLERVGFLDLNQARGNFSELEILLPTLRDPLRQTRLLSSLRSHGAPDWGLANLLKLADSKANRKAVEQVLDKEETLHLLTLLVSRSSQMTEILAKEPLLFETLVGRPSEILADSFGWKFLRSHGDVARYRSFNEFGIMLRFLLGMDSLANATRRLSDLADELIERAFSEVASANSSAGLEAAVLALGKLGGQELMIGSDLDLILLYKGRDVSSSASNAERVAQMFLEKFTASSKVYEADLQMRPEGKSSPLATELEYYRSYLQQRASLWERQSLLKARVVCGHPPIKEAVEKIVLAALYGQPLPMKWEKEIRTMRKRVEEERGRPNKRQVDLKVGKGGLLDLEFLLQALQLGLGLTGDPLRGRNSFHLAEQLANKRILTKRESKKLLANLLYLRRLETIVRLNSENSAFLLPVHPIHLRAIAAAMGERSTAAFLKRIEVVKRENRILFNASMRKCRSAT